MANELPEGWTIGKPIVDPARPGGLPEGWTTPPPAEIAKSAVTAGKIPESEGGSFQTFDDYMRAAANAVTFGMADRAAGVLNRATGLTKAPDYSSAVEEELARSAAGRKRSPTASIAGDVSGVVGSVAALPAMGPAIATARGSGLGARALGYGIEGSLLGGAQGAGNTYTENPIDYLTNAGKGAGIGGVLGMAGGAAFGRRPPTSAAATPTVAELRDAASRGYTDLRNSPATYDPQHFARYGRNVEQDLLNEGFHQSYSPGTWRAIDRTQIAAGVPGAVVTPANIDLIRKGLNRIPFSELSKTDRESARILRERLDDFLVNPPPGAVLPGGRAAAADAARIADEARGNYAARMRGEKMQNIMTAAEDTAAASHSGLNVENEVRKAVKNFINPNTAGFASRTRGFTRDEIDMLRNEIVHRGMVANAARTVGNMMGGGGGIAAPLAAGVIGGAASNYAGSNPLYGVAIPLAGMALRGASNRSAMNAIERATEQIRQRSPLYQERAAVAGMRPGRGLPDPGTATVRDAVTLEWLRQQMREREADNP
jgi:hypothetical protein